MPPQTPNTSGDEEELLREFAEALSGAGIETSLSGTHLGVDGFEVELHIVTRSRPTADEISALEAPRGRVLVVIADRLNKDARVALREHNMGWLDRRGKIGLWTSGLKLDLSFDPQHHPGPRRAPKTFTPAVRDVALALLLDPARVPSPRRLGRELNRSPGYVSTVLSGLTDDGLLRADGTPLVPELFWALAEAHRAEWVPVDDDLSDLRDEGLAVASGAAGAEAWGAPVLLGATSSTRLILESESIVRRLSRGAARATAGGKVPGEAGHTEIRHEPNYSLAVFTHPITERRVTHPVLCALDLADDQRGRETIESWTPTDPQMGVLATLDVYRHTGIAIQPPDLVDRLDSNTGWRAAIAAYWGDEYGSLAHLYCDDRLPDQLRPAIKERIVEHAFSSRPGGNEYVAGLNIRVAPELLLDERFRSFEIERSEDALEAEVEDAFRSTDYVTALHRIASRTVDELRTSGGTPIGKNEAVRRSALLLRLGRVAGFDESTQVALASFALPQADTEPDHRSAIGWPSPSGYRARWSSGHNSDRRWHEAGNRASDAERLSKPRRQRLLNEFLDADLDGRAMPLADLLPYLDGTDATEAVAAIAESASGVANLDERASVLAAAARYVDGPERDALLGRALKAAADAVDPTSRRLSRNDHFEPRGVPGHLEVANVAKGTQRRAALEGGTAAWMRWIERLENEAKGDAHSRFGPMVEHPFEMCHSLVEMLAVEGMVDEVRGILGGVRSSFNKESNIVDVLIARTAWPALKGGNLELAALYVAEAAIDTPWRKRDRQHQRESNEVVEPPSEPPAFPMFPGQLMGFRRVWS